MDIQKNDKLYEIFGLTKLATTKELDKSYKLLVTKYHPEVNIKNYNKFIEINDAYWILAQNRLKF